MVLTLVNNHRLPSQDTPACIFCRARDDLKAVIRRPFPQGTSHGAPAIPPDKRRSTRQRAPQPSAELRTEPDYPSADLFPLALARPALGSRKSPAFVMIAIALVARVRAAALAQGSSPFALSGGPRAPPNRAPRSIRQIGVEQHFLGKPAFRINTEIKYKFDLFGEDSAAADDLLDLALRRKLPRLKVSEAQGERRRRRRSGATGASIGSHLRPP